MQRIIRYIFISLLVLNIFYVTLGAYLYPMASIDAVAIWYMKAKLLYLTHGNLPLVFFTNPVYEVAHPQYPLLVPYFFYLIYLLLGSVNASIVAFINPLLYVLIIIIVYKFLRKVDFSQNLALMFTYIYSMLSPLLGHGGRKHSGDMDIFITCINWLAVVCSYQFVKKRSLKYLWMLVLLIMLASQIKGEGIFLATIILFLPLTVRLKVLTLFLSLIPFLLWQGIILYYHIPVDIHYAVPSLQELLMRPAQIVYYTSMEMLKVNNWYIFWPVFLLFIMFSRLKSVYLKTIILPTLFTMSGLFFLFYLFVTIPPTTYVPGSMDRILLQLSPFYYVLFAILIRNKIFPDKKVLSLPLQQYVKEKQRHSDE